MHLLLPLPFPALRFPAFLSLCFSILPSNAFTTSTAAPHPSRKGVPTRNRTSPSNGLALCKNHQSAMDRVLSPPAQITVGTSHDSSVPGAPTVKRSCWNSPGNQSCFRKMMLSTQMRTGWSGGSIKCQRKPSVSRHSRSVHLSFAIT